jgi:hypothetical protein
MAKRIPCEVFYKDISDFIGLRQVPINKDHKEYLYAMREEFIKQSLMRGKGFYFISDDDTLFKIYSSMKPKFQKTFTKRLEIATGDDIYHYKDCKYFFSEFAQDVFLDELYKLVTDKDFYKLVIPHIDKEYYLNYISKHPY